jgi:hypothetical protein
MREEAEKVEWMGVAGRTYSVRGESRRYVVKKANILARGDMRGRLQSDSRGETANRSYLRVCKYKP